MWTEAIYDLKLTEEAFWSMTPRQLVWLRDRHKLEREYQELIHVGIMTATLVNHSFNPPKIAHKPYDFMPTKLREKSERGPKKRWTRNNFAQQLVAMRQSMPAHFVVKPTQQKPE